MVFGTLSFVPDGTRTPGDADRNGKVNINDVLLIQQFIAEWDVELI